MCIPTLSNGQSKPGQSKPTVSPGRKVFASNVGGGLENAVNTQRTIGPAKQGGGLISVLDKKTSPAAAPNTAAMATGETAYNPGKSLLSSFSSRARANPKFGD